MDINLPSLAKLDFPVTHLVKGGKIKQNDTQQ